MDRGLSAVVSTVMILVVTVIAVTILAQIVVPYVKNELHRSTECTDLQDRFIFQAGDNFNCYKSSSPGEVTFAIKAQGNNNVQGVAGFNIMLIGSDKGKVLEVRKEKSSIPNAGEFYTYKFALDGAYNSAQLSTVLDSGRVCEMKSDEINLEAC